MGANLQDTSTWLPLDGLAPGFDANKAAPVQDLDGQSFRVAGDGGPLEVSFSGDSVQWSMAGRSGTDPCEVFAVAEDLYYAQWHSGADGAFALSLFLDLASGRALSITAFLGEAAQGETAVRHVFHPGTIDGMAARGPALGETAALLGRRVEWVYSPIHAYEHIYLSPQWYTWQCLAGPERGLADTDTNTTYQLRPGIYVFTWREKVIPCGSITVADHRDITAIRSHGYLFGWNEAGTDPVHFTFGAHGRLVSMSRHSAGLEPA
ncbi:MoaF C-terminal domain-containing protein [Pseudarthrobacter sp. P1]|uniref:MoaF C-terminal domain-containing protein n=1 Tax=Pseudarthrobacter sp. P1 TaxID=3418418 RepID=UPI003CF28A19